MRFVFRLEPLLQHRLHAESVKRAGFEQARCELEKAENILTRLRGDFERRHGEQAGVHGIDQVALAEISSAIDRQRAAIAAHAAKVEFARTVLLRAQRDRKALELLKQRRQQAKGRRPAPPMLEQ